MRLFFFFFKQKTAYEISACLVGSEMCIRDRIGYNSDVIGFTQSIEPLLEPQHKKALILGTGGASKAIAYGLKKLGLECKFVSRNLREEMLTYDQLTPEIMDEYKVIVNCTPVGLSLIHISEPTRQAEISYAVFCLKKKKNTTTDA